MGVDKVYRYSVLLLILIVVWCVPALVTRTSFLTLEDTDSSGFDIVFVYGVKAGRVDPVNRLDTRVDLFRKDMVADPPIEFRLVLGEEDMMRVLAKMDEIGFYGYPDRYTPRIIGPMVSTVTPFMTYDLTLYHDGVVVKHVRMDTDIWSEDARTLNLKSLFILIMQTIQESEEYRNSPEPTSGYC